MHLMALHVHGSTNPLGISTNIDRLPFHGYFVFKDLVTVFLLLLIFCLFVFFSPNTLGHPDNYIPGNPLVTPASIAYITLIYFIILKNINNKLLSFIPFKEIKYNKNMTKQEIIKLLDNSINPVNYNYNSDEIKSILNGYFQAEGHIGGYFSNKQSVTFNPLVFISQNASIESIKLFKIMNHEFNNELKYNLYKLNSGE
jgi:hypothetical protein